MRLHASDLQPGMTTKEPAKIIARYADGSVLKGTSLNFSPARATFFLLPADAGATDEPVTVRLSDLKGVFFVRDLTGDSKYNERKEFESPPAGRKIVVTFVDGERLVGTSLTYDASRDGFFLFPADPLSNNERVYVIARAVSNVERL
jgi:hypothetical protein